MDAAEIALLGKSRTIISHQAQMAANRGVIPPIPELRAAGCPIALGTDNNTNDVFEVMRIALLTERVSRNDRFPGFARSRKTSSPTPLEGGARRASISRSSSALSKSARRRTCSSSTRSGPISCLPAGSCRHVIHSGHPSDIESVMVDGQFLMRSNKVLTMDEAGSLPKPTRWATHLG